MAKRARPQPVQQLLQPEDFRHLLSADDFTALMAELQQPLLPSFRVNPLKIDPGQAPQTWSARYGWKLAQVPFCQEGWRVEQSPNPISRTVEHNLGQYYIQDAASMLPAGLFDRGILENGLVLDMAASPGGKTTHLNARMGDRGLVLANDSSQERITALRLVLQNWGTLNAAVSNFPGERFGEWFPETFDGVLLDAPCSMQGLRSSESHAMRPITAREVGQLAVRQARLLSSALRSVRPGGQVVYSTCTLTLEENEGVLQSILDQFGSLVSLADSQICLPSAAPAMAGNTGDFGTRQLNPALAKAVRLWPHRFGTSGFFAALLVKNDRLPGKVSTPPRRPVQLAGLTPLPSGEVRALAGMLEDEFGFHLSAALQDYALELWRLGKTILALPTQLFTRLLDFPVQLAGLALGEGTPDGFQVGHDWVSRFHTQFISGRLVLDEQQAAAWLRGEDLKGFAGTGLRLLEDPCGRWIGRGRLGGCRLKNLLPRRWF